MHVKQRLVCLTLVSLGLYVSGCGTATSTSSDSSSATAPAAPAFTATPTGLKYRILKEGTGPKPLPTDSVLAHYIGWLPDPTDTTKKLYSFDASRSTAFLVAGASTETLQSVLELAENSGAELLGTKEGLMSGQEPTQIRFTFLSQEVQNEIVATIQKGGGRILDSRASNEPFQFPLTKDPATGMGVIDGWEQGAQLVGTGGTIELEIPPDLAYGEGGAGGIIPPNATLRFIIEVLEIVAQPLP